MDAIVPASLESRPPPRADKFRHPDLTATGERRASVAFEALRTLWFNTGTLCNITCAHCYIESSPRNDRLAYLRLDEVVAKVRDGPPADDEADYALGVWAGEVPVRQVIDPPVDDPRLKAGIEAPDYLAHFEVG